MENIIALLKVKIKCREKKISNFTLQKHGKILQSGIQYVIINKFSSEIHELSLLNFINALNVRQNNALSLAAQGYFR